MWFVYSVYFLTLYLYYIFICMYLFVCVHVYMHAYLHAFWDVFFFFYVALKTELWSPVLAANTLVLWAILFIDVKFESEIRMYCQPTALFLIKLSFKIKGKIVSIIETIHPKQTCCVTYFYFWCIIHISISRKEYNIDLLVHPC